MHSLWDGVTGHHRNYMYKRYQIGARQRPIFAVTTIAQMTNIPFIDYFRNCKKTYDGLVLKIFISAMVVKQPHEFPLAVEQSYVGVNIFGLLMASILIAGEKLTHAGDPSGGEPWLQLWGSPDAFSQH